MVEEQVRRKMVLTEADIKALVAEMKRQGLFHTQCRYNIDPEKMEKLLGFVEAFYDTSVETRRTFRTMAIRLIVWSALVAFLLWLADRVGFLRPVIERVLKG
jgi:hypothetical protein